MMQLLLLLLLLLGEHGEDGSLLGAHFGYWRLRSDVSTTRSSKHKH